MAKAKEPVLDEEFAYLLPPQTPEERESLTKSIIEEGVREPLIVWEEKGILIDGYNRYDVCHRLKIPCRYVVKSFPDRAAVIEWMVQNQLGRRNLTAEKLAYFRGKQYLAVKPEGEAGQIVRPGEKTAAQVGEMHGVSEKTIRRDAAFAQAVDASPDRAEILAGTSGKTKQEVIDSKPLHCKRCIRVGMPVKNCDDCAKLQAAAGKKKRKSSKKAKVGNVKYGWPEYWKDIGRIVRATDAIFAAYDQKNSDYHKAAVAAMGSYVKQMKVCEKSLNKVA